MSATNNDSASGSSSNNADSFDHGMKAMEEQINNLSLAFTRLMKESSESKSDDSAIRNQEDSDSTEEDKGDEEFDDIDIPSEYQLSEPVFNKFKNIINNQGLLDEEVCILKKNEISEMNELFNLYYHIYIYYELHYLFEFPKYLRQIFMIKIFIKKTKNFEVAR
ncbi:hypothetical protein ACTA71_009026 [Dictyostelium dimigraforme]